MLQHGKRSISSLVIREGIQISYFAVSSQNTSVMNEDYWSNLHSVCEYI